jgi:hypothetical protein
VSIRERSNAPFGGRRFADFASRPPRSSGRLGSDYDPRKRSLEQGVGCTYSVHAREQGIWTRPGLVTFKAPPLVGARNRSARRSVEERPLASERALLTPLSSAAGCPGCSWRWRPRRL